MTLVERSNSNPILTKDQVPYPVSTVHNAGICKYDDQVIMLFRSHRRNGRSIIGLARSSDGIHFEVDPDPFLTPAESGPFARYEQFGVEDVRITPIEGEGYYLTYSAYSPYGVRIHLGMTKDFKTVERVAPISQPDMRNVVLFPERINGHYLRLDRPHSEIMPWSIWLSSSPDLIHWGNSQLVMQTEKYHWDEMKIGPGAPPIKTSSGWLNIYHGVFETMAGAVYRMGVALHDLEDPAQIIGIADEWILEPQDPWERVGYVNNVVFCCGAILLDDQKTLRLYWGCADTVMACGTCQVSDLVDMCKSAPRPGHKTATEQSFRRTSTEGLR